MDLHDSQQRSPEPYRPADRPGHAAAPAAGAAPLPPLPRGWEARARFDGGWTLARSGRAQQAIVIRWATLALATVSGAVFLFGHELLELVGRGIESLGLVLMGTGLVAIYWLEHRGPVYCLRHGRIERRSGLGGRLVRVYEAPTLVLTGGTDGWALVLRHDHVPEILANALPPRDALALAAFVTRHAAARVDLPDALERELAEHGADAAADDLDDVVPRTGTHA